ncbi:hypothetical protein DXG01_006515 [Tephrocybe rancida]|nr:hypothetical protein DXG01_006515 [Tephrocybe rancida]
MSLLMSREEILSAVKYPNNEVQTMLTNRFKELPLQKANNVKPRVLHTNRLTKNQFGKLQGFKELPMEIGALLEPKDLLALTRVSKFYRSLFLSQKSRSIWTRVLKNVDLPECWQFALRGLPSKAGIYSLLPSGRERDTSSDNRKYGPYLMVEMDLVMSKCNALCHDEKALKKYMQDRQVMSSIIGQIPTLDVDVEYST